MSRIPVGYELEPGQTLSDALTELGLAPGSNHRVAQALAQHLNLRRLRAGTPYLAYYDRGARLVALEWPVEQEGRVVVERGADTWIGRWEPYRRRVEIRSISGELGESLIGSIEAAGAAESLAYKMAWVLQWDLDFNRDLRRGDRFRVLYEQIFLDDQDSGPGGILALTYDNGGRRLEAFRFRDEDSYYDAEGRPLKKMFLRSPLRFSRITSGFSRRRFHPILKDYRPHYGVDYGAPVGTPVRVTAGGVVSFAGWSGGSGRMVKVRHPNSYMTAYLHLSRFAKGIRAGRRVQQGEVVGYVGASGLATGPHLDYRVRHQGRWINPLSLKSVPAEPIREADLEEFRLWRDALEAGLESGVIPSAELALMREDRFATDTVAGAAVAR